MYTALRLQRRLRRRRGARSPIVDPQSYMTYQPFLPESAAGNLEPRHLVVPLRKVLKRCEILNGRIASISHERRIGAVRADPRVPAGTCSYDVLVVAPGSIARTMPIPGLAERGIGFHTVAEAIYLRNQVLSRLDLAASTDDDKPAQAGADLCLHRWRLRRHRGDGRARGHGPRRTAVLSRPDRARHDAGSWSRRPGGSCPRSARHGRVHRPPAREARHRGTPQHQGRVDDRRPGGAHRRFVLRGRHDRVDRGRAGQPDVGGRPTSRSTTRSG